MLCFSRFPSTTSSTIAFTSEEMSVFLKSNFRNVEFSSIISTIFSPIEFPSLFEEMSNFLIVLLNRMSISTNSSIDLSIEQQLRFNLKIIENIKFQEIIQNY